MHADHGPSGLAPLSRPRLPSPTQFIVSSTRDEPRVLPASSSSRYNASNALAPSFPRSIHYPAYARFMQQNRPQVSRGVLPDGRMTVKHPIVEAFLEKTPAVSAAEGRKVVEAWWTRGVRPKTVSEVLDNGITLNQVESECVYVLAALKVLHHPLHPKHFAFWSKSRSHKTAQRVEKLLALRPCPIDSPVGWVGTTENLWLVQGLQYNLFRPKQEGTEANNGMLLRKRNQQEAALAEEKAEVEERPRKRIRAKRGARKDVSPDVPDCAAPLISVSPPSATPLEEVQPGVPRPAEDELVAAGELPNGPARLSASPAPLRKSARAPSNSPAPEPSRRSARCHNKRVADADVNAANAASDDVDRTPTPAPENVGEVTVRPAIARARSSSTSGGSITAVSDTRFASVETAVDAEAAAETKVGGKRKRGVAFVVEEAEAEAEEKKVVRTSGRVRKPAAKAQKVDGAELDTEEVAPPAKKKAAAPSSRSRPAKRKA